MATRKKPIEQIDTRDTVLGGDHAEWELVMDGTSLDIRKCTNCGFESNFPKNMTDCTWTACPNCHKEMRW